MKSLLNSLLNPSNRYNFIIIKCKSETILDIINQLATDSIESINIGQEVAKKLTDKTTKHLTIQVSGINKFNCRK